MDFAQDRVTTLHDLSGATPSAPVDESVVVVPIAAESTAAATPDHVFEALARVDPAGVVVPFRGPRSVAAALREWVNGYDLSVMVLWCNAPAVERTLAAHDLDGRPGKGRDVWLGLGVAGDRAEYVAVHDADATSYDETVVPRLLAPLETHEFVKGYYARVEDGRLYGRLARLFVAPLLRALDDRHDAAVVDYLSAFRYPLAGEFALTGRMARQFRACRNWGLEIGTLGEAFARVGARRSAQVDLGVYRHDHKPVSGHDGLLAMSDRVGEALLRTVEEAGVDVDYRRTKAAYREAADRLIDQYAADAAFNGLSYDPTAEREQADQYASSVRPPETETGPESDDRLPAWVDVDLSPATVVEAARPAGD
ncbi:glycosyl transferase family 2 [Halobacteriales archaeon SW_7_71_33]|nr:MAG: glycosyl transferase family 2 [Halobacteriales archaeon SW_7_71_33]